VTGTRRKWQRVTVSFRHSAELAQLGSPNPFRDYRLDVEFVHAASGTVVRVPGFFAADGRAADTGATAGRTWQARFTPPLVGQWSYCASFRQGANVATSDDPLAGQPVSFDGACGSFEIGPLDPTAPGFLRKGMLLYVGEHHLRFMETHERFLKGGADSPENFLGYFEFDGTFNLPGGGYEGALASLGGLHIFDDHLVDFDEDDPVDRAGLWRDGRGKGILGALNYLSGQGVNSVYFLTYNSDGGDGRDTWPWVDPDDPAKDRFDVSKLDQWERVFTHMDARGIQLHLVMHETENEQTLGGLTLERRLYYRELVARFAHHLALSWNLGEENGFDDPTLLTLSTHLRALDPYDHPITVHSFFGESGELYDGLLGSPNLDATSIQGPTWEYNTDAALFRETSMAAGRPWAVQGDEQSPAVAADMGNLDLLRREALWGNLCGGGAGVEWYFGYQGDHFGDLQTDDFTLAAELWRQTKVALDFFQHHLHFHRMSPANDLTPQADDYVLAEPSHAYAVYGPAGSASTELDVGPVFQAYTVRWYDPVLGGPLQTGSLASVAGPGLVSLGAPPAGGDDWVVLVRRAANTAPHVLEIGHAPEPFHSGPTVFTVRVHDEDGPQAVTEVTLLAWRPDGTYAGSLRCERVGGNLWAWYRPALGAVQPGTWNFIALARDDAGAVGGLMASFVAQ
jgi:hypothetical protein